MKRLALVEDNLAVSAHLLQFLAKCDYRVTHFTDGREALLAIKTRRAEVDLVLLDLNLPSLSGLKVCQKLRQLDVSLPIIVLTASDDISVIIQALDSGADDYLIKPFSYAELAARIRAQLRRPPEFIPKLLEIGDLSLDLYTQELRVAGELVVLRRREFQILQFLMQHSDQIIPREKLLQQIWRDPTEINPNTVDVYIRSLRLKIGRHRIRTIHGTGYRLVNA